MAGKTGQSGRPLHADSLTGVLDGIAPKTRQAHRELFEAFCCAQIKRIQRTLANVGKPIETEPGKRNLICEVRGTSHYDGPKRGGCA